MWIVGNDGNYVYKQIINWHQSSREADLHSVLMRFIFKGHTNICRTYFCRAVNLLLRSHGTVMRWMKYNHISHWVPPILKRTMRSKIWRKHCIILQKSAVELTLSVEFCWFRSDACIRRKHKHYYGGVVLYDSIRSRCWGNYVHVQYMFMSRQHNTGLIYSINMTSKSFENVIEFRYLGAALAESHSRRN
jgi:hypothetical protein